MTSTPLKDFIKEVIANETGIKSSAIKDTQSFFELGIDSITAVYLLELVEKKYEIELTPLYFWDYPTIEKFADKVEQELRIK
ncbi:acyl carrier protein [Fulvivirga lutea]|uniref:Acyl carrier protein n=1 Tax=Fulvivirga lutea TaxID=2810512 RepID=A0A974WFM0_9BACT|nr:acyl carrier protein [Fulvivirga lutea]QSE96217.1 acyl carrier protein [Fulvivirga lutea]